MTELKTTLAEATQIENKSTKAKPGEEERLSKKLNFQEIIDFVEKKNLKYAKEPTKLVPPYVLKEKRRLEAEERKLQAEKRKLEKKKKLQASNAEDTEELTSSDKINEASKRETNLELASKNETESRLIEPTSTEETVLMDKKAIISEEVEIDESNETDKTAKIDDTEVEKPRAPVFAIGDTVICGFSMLSQAEIEEIERNEQAGKQDKNKNKKKQKRAQYYEGVIISQKTKNKGVNWSVTVRRIMQGIGMEKVVLVHSPKLTSLVTKSSAQVRRSKLYYLRNLSGKASKLKQQF